MELFRSLTSAYRPCGLRSIEGSTSRRHDSDEFQSVVSSPSSSPSSSRRSASHYPPEMGLEETPDPSPKRVYVAVGKTKEKAVWLLRWTFRKFPGREVFLLHVHRPSATIPTLLGKLPASQANKEALESHRTKENEEMRRTVCYYLSICRVNKVPATTIVTEATQEQSVIVGLVAKFGIQTLVMGSDRDGWLKANVGLGKSQYVAKNIAPFCNICFIYKGKHVWTRKATEDFDTSCRSSLAADRMKSGSTPCPKGMLGSNLNIPHVVWDKVWFWFWFGFDWFWLGSDPSKPEPSMNARDNGYYDPFGTLKPVKQAVERVGSCVLQCSYFSSASKCHTGQTASSSSASTSDSGEYVIIRLVLDSEEGSTEVESFGCDTLSETAGSKGSDPYSDESAIEVNKKEMFNVKESNLPDGSEDNLRETEMELEKLLMYREEITDELQKALKVISFQGVQEVGTSNLQSDVTPQPRSLHLSLSDLRRQISSIKKLRDEAIQMVQLFQDVDAYDGSSSSLLPEFFEYSLPDLQAATFNFAESCKLGQGCYGCVYKGEIYGRPVSIKRFIPKEGHTICNFMREVKMLSKLHHPNLVTLFGACSEALCLVQEYMPNGNLQQHLFHSPSSAPLPWKLRVRIAAQIASALLFLHSSKPEKIVHGDLKPENVLLDSDFTCKLGDFGLSCLMSEKAVECSVMLENDAHKSSWAYVDHEFQRTRNLTTASDVYAFGIVVLQLVTGRPPKGLTKEVRDAAATGKLDGVVDVSAGKWPMASLRRMVELGLSCCQLNIQDRMELSLSVVQELEHMI